jgi:hypothetical protein
MPGIAPDPQQPDQSQDQQPSQGPDEVGDEEGLAPNVSPEEQKQYEEFVLSGMAIIYTKASDGKTPMVRPGILKLLDDDPTDLKGILNAQELDQFSPVVAIAATAVIIVIEIQKLATDEKIPDDILMHGGAAIIEELAEVWMRRNKSQLSEDDVHKALSVAMDIYREVGADQGLVNENALKDEFNKLVVADKSGKLAEVSPELAGINKAAQMNMDQPSDQQEEQSEPVDNADEEEKEQQ